jgi:hypothetical protein
LSAEPGEGPAAGIRSSLARISHQKRAHRARQPLAARRHASDPLYNPDLVCEDWEAPTLFYVGTCAWNNDTITNQIIAPCGSAPGGTIETTFDRRTTSTSPRAFPVSCEQIGFGDLLLSPNMLNRGSSLTRQRATTQLPDFSCRNQSGGRPETLGIAKGERRPPTRG